MTRLNSTIEAIIGYVAGHHILTVLVAAYFMLLMTVSAKIHGCPVMDLDVFVRSTSVWCGTFYAAAVVKILIRK